MAVLDALDAVAKRWYASRGNDTEPPPPKSDAATASVDDAVQRACGAQRDAYWNSYALRTVGVSRVQVEHIRFTPYIDESTLGFNTL